jgi:hypothetical protein
MGFQRSQDHPELGDPKTNNKREKERKNIVPVLVL